MKMIGISLLTAGFLLVFAVPVSAADPLLTPIGSTVEPIAAFLNDQGVFFFKAGRMDAAMTSFSTAIERDPGFARAHFNAAVTLARGGELDAAINHMEEAILLDSTNKDVLTTGAREEARDLISRWRKVHFKRYTEYGWGGFFEYGMAALLGFGIAFCAYGWILYDHGIPGLFVEERPVEEVYEFKKAA